MSWRRLWPTTAVWVMMLAFTLYFAAFAIQRHNTLNSHAADLSLIDQPMWNTLQGNFMLQTWYERQQPRLAEHFEPILLLVAPLYLLWDDVRLMLALQVAVMALGALPIYWLARRVLGGSYFALVFPAAYLLHPSLGAAALADFHADPLITAPLAFAGYYALERRWRRMWVWALLAMATKENLPTLMLVLGVGIFLWLPPQRAGAGFWSPERKHGAALALVSAAWFFTATFLIVAPLARSYFGTEGPIYLAQRFGGQPLHTLLLDLNRWEYLAWLLVPVGGLALLAPRVLLVGAPVLVANFFSDYWGQYSGEQHYSAPLVPVLAAAAVFGARRLLKKTNGGAWARLALGSWLLAAALVTQYFQSYLPYARDFHWYQHTAHTRLFERFSKQVPPAAPLSASEALHPHLAHREKIYLFPAVQDADTILIDVSGITNSHPADVQRQVLELLAAEWGVLDAADGYLLLRRGGEQLPRELPEAFFDFARVEGARPQYPLLLTFEPSGLRLLGYDLLDEPKLGWAGARFYWQRGPQPPPEDLRLYPFFYTPTGQLLNDPHSQPMLAELWYPPTRWREGEVIATEMRPWRQAPAFAIGVALADAASLYGPADRERLRLEAGEARLFAGGAWAQIGAFERRHRARPAPLDLPWQRRNVLFGEAVRASGVYAPTWEVAAGGAFHVALRWQLETELPQGATVFVHLLDEGSEIIGQSDQTPTWVFPHPWPAHPGEVLYDGHHIELPAELPPGRYRVLTGWYLWPSLERLPMAEGDALLLGTLEVRRPPLVSREPPW